jgi:hypothetical protein
MLPLLLLLASSGSTHAWIDDAGNLIVVGDDADNRINIASAGCGPELPGIPKPGTYQVWSNNSTINGMPGSQGVALVPFGKAIRVYLGGGNDRLAIDCTLRLDVEYHGGDGNDGFSSGLSDVHGDVTLDGGAGDDLVDFQDSFFRGRFDVRDMALVYIFYGVVLGDVRIEADVVLDANGGHGSSVDVVAREASFFGNPQFLGVVGDLTITADYAPVVGFNAPRDLRISGASVARVLNLDVGQSLFVTLGPGSDLLQIDMVSIGKESRVDGGRGLDALLRGQVVGATLQVVGFEAVPRLRR